MTVAFESLRWKNSPGILPVSTGFTSYLEASNTPGDFPADLTYSLSSLYSGSGMLAKRAMTLAIFCHSSFPDTVKEERFSRMSVTTSPLEPSRRKNVCAALSLGWLTISVSLLLPPSPSTSSM